MTPGPFRRTLSLLGAVAIGAAGWVPAASAAPAASSAEAVMIRGGHFSPDTPGVDVYLTAFRGGTKKLWLSGVGYGDVSAYQKFRPGVYAVSMRPHGAPASTPAALTWTLDARAGASYTACAVGMNAQLQGIVLADDLSMPPAGQARVRVIQAASRAPQARVAIRQGPTLAARVAFAKTTGYTSVAAGQHRITAAALGGSGLQASSEVDLAADSVHTAVVLDAKGGGITVRVLDDAAGAAAPPGGAVPAGGGGTAPGSPGPRPTGVVIALLAVTSLAIAAATMRRRHRAGPGR